MITTLQKAETCIAGTAHPKNWSIEANLCTTRLGLVGLRLTVWALCFKWSETGFGSLASEILWVGDIVIKISAIMPARFLANSQTLPFSLDFRRMAICLPRRWGSFDTELSHSENDCEQKEQCEDDVWADAFEPSGPKCHLKGEFGLSESSRHGRFHISLRKTPLGTKNSLYKFAPLRPLI